jgi:methylase of polypeptide subunit release factors
MGDYLQVRGVGEAYVPSAWEHLVEGDVAARQHALKGPRPSNALLKELRLGRCAVVCGAWVHIDGLLDELARRRASLAPQKGGAPRRGEHRRHQPKADPLDRVLVLAEADGALLTEPPLEVPHLIELMGEPRLVVRDSFPAAPAAGGALLAVPATAIRSLLAALEESYPISTLGIDLLAPNTVLQPRLQEVYDLVDERLQELALSLGECLRCLDMGCGSGALTLTVARALSSKASVVWATDALPEALATTRLNVARCEEMGIVPPGLVRIGGGGDLYEPLGDQRFELITFNPPWARRQPRTRLEIARFDPGQRTLERFLADTPAHLEPSGRLLLVYADNAGPGAIENLERMAREAGFEVSDKRSRRIRVARRWEHLYLYDLVLQSSASG